MRKKFGKDELMKGSLILFLMINVFNLFNYIFQFSMARMLSVADYGVLAVLMSIIYIFTVPSEAIQNIIAKHISKFNINKEFGKMKFMFKKSLKKSLFFAFVAFIIFFIISFFLSKFLRIDIFLLWIVGIFLFFMFLLPVFRGVIQGRKKFYVLGWNMILEGAVKLSLAIFLVFIGLKVYGAMIAVLLSVFFAIIFAIFSIKEIRDTKEKKTNFEKIYYYSIPYFVVVLVVVLMYSLDVIIARGFFSADIVGSYAVLSMLGKVIFLCTFSLSKAMFPIASENYEKNKKTKFILKKSLKLTGIISAFILVIYYFFSKLIISLFFGNKYIAFSNLLILVGISYFFLSLTNISLLYGLATNKIKKNSGFLFIFVILQLILFYFMHSSVLLFCLALIISNAIFFIYSLFLIK